MKTLLSITILITLPPLQAEPISYNRDVRPILSENCFFCHGFDKNKREGDLRLDRYEDAIAPRDGKPAITPGKPDQSELIARILTSDPDDQMPPADSAYSLTAAQKNVLSQWIKEGAQYEEHWAYRKLSRPTVPSSAAHPVDAFISRGWEKHQVSPVGKADPRTLLRRLSYDLRGLPPSGEEITAFLKDPSVDQYNDFVAQWLGSIEHAEHQGLLWLDLVRHADSNGMVSDEPIASGPYRKYVIESFRDNMPFDQFTREQLAGDLLPDRNDRTLTASAYNRLVKTNCEAGGIEKEALYAMKGDHVRALGTVWLGATTGCAECHDHKYDPITAKDYYSMAAFFDDLIEVGIYEPGDRRVPLHHLYEDPKRSERDWELSSRIEQLRHEIYSAEIEPAALAAWSKDILEASKQIGSRKEPQDWVWLPSKLPLAQVVQGHFVQTSTGRMVDAPAGSITRHLAGETMTSSPPKDCAGLFTHLTIDPDNPPEFVAFQTINGAYRQMGWHRDYHLTYYWGPKDHPLLKKNYPWIAPSKLVHMGPLPEFGKTVRLEVPKKKIASSPQPPLGMAWIQAGGRVTWGDSGHISSPHRCFTDSLAESATRYFWELPLNRDEREDIPKLLLTSLKMDPAKRRDIHTLIIEIAYRESIKPELVEQLNEAYREAYLLRQNATPSLVSKAGVPKETHVLTRGNYMDESGPLAVPAIPEAFGKVETGKRLNRLDLANWLTSSENPLTARVFVNRLWHQFYGRGISETLDDSGNQGAWPSHVDLLDWMAAEFQESGWDVRHMIKLLVTSDAYKLSSIPGPELAGMDPTNRLHARQGRARLSAEEIRDSALNAAGLISRTEEIPKKSFFPYQPGSYWEKSNKIMYGSRYQIWETNAGESQYQRSLYTFWKRQNIHPAMLALDAPTRQECTAQRIISNTPAQALALLNDPQFVEAARVLAARLMDEAHDEKRMDHLFQLTLQRAPNHEEKAELRALYQQLLARFTEHPDEADALLKIGQFPPASHPPIEHAAWTATARVVLNLHEFITRS